MKKKKRSKLYGLLAVLLMGLLVLNSCGEGTKISEVVPEDEVILKEAVATSGSLWIKGKALGTDCPMIFSKGRLYISATSLTSQGDLDIREMGTKSSGTAPLIKDGEIYYLVNDLARVYDLWPVFEETGIRLFACQKEEAPGPMVTTTAPAEDQTDPITEAPATPAREFACLRLEDITADPSPQGRFTHEKLEKIRTMGWWLHIRDQEYSIAWIPLFNDPMEDGVNDLTKEYNFLNSDFMYTLDYLLEHGGHIGLHGLTHQERDNASGVGVEFGKDSPFSDKEIKERLIYAKEIANKLGYQPEFFEFPHYATTEVQAKIAEELFPVIYQQKSDRKPIGRLEWSDKAGKKVLYVPTPADYVCSPYDKQGILDRINNLEKGTLVSLFFHPSMDYDRITCDTDETGTRILSYNQNGILPAILETIQKKGLNFEIPWE